jgi:hypothetical protein
VRPLPPGSVVASEDGGDITVTWSAGSDDKTPTAGLTYNVRVGTGTETDNVMPGHAVIGGLDDGVRKIPVMGNVGHNTSCTLKGLLPGTYHVSVQTIDGALAGSTWAGEQTVVVPP